jgi:hypothetical protein
MTTAHTERSSRQRWTLVLVCTAAFMLLLPRAMRCQPLYVSNARRPHEEET